jgi:hypothetical protein
MKVNGPGPVQNNAIRRTRKGADRGGKGGFAEEVAATDAEPAAPTQVRGPSSLAPVDALIALQEVEDATTGRKRAMGNGKDMLDLLDNIRHGLLIGGISRGKLDSLVRAVKSERQAVEDPKLQEVLDEIELRAAVELAKYEQG